MQHGITEQQWLAFLEDSLEPRERMRIQAHLDGCPDCRNLYSEMHAWGQAIARGAAKLRAGAELSEVQIERFVAMALIGIRVARRESKRRNESWSVPEALVLLRALLAPFCGLGTARAAVQLAVRESDLDEEGSASGTHWGKFVAYLTQTISQQCGISTGRLVGRVGVCLESGEG
ncbi:MAG: hypothetical protein JWP63_4407 [Candidatus Solibacter sp.]|jgi:hypothetical protein|nr:hypothetical protein [Candidatus Solibacter sp.]